MLLRKKGPLTAFLLLLCTLAGAQRFYAASSVLASGNWYKLACTQNGIYKLDIAFLNNLGINTSSLSSSSIRIFSNTGHMLSEAMNQAWTDDLAENAISIVDGGDGILNGPDYILFYGTWPDEWIKDSANQRFTHRKNLYTDRSYYFLNIGTNGRRVASAPAYSNPAVTVSSFNGRYFHELDSLNFLNSGKEWYGEEFTNAPGKTLTRQFISTLPFIQPGSTVGLVSNCISRSVTGGSRFDISVNNTSVSQLMISPTGTGIYDAFAQEATAVGSFVANQDQLTVNYNYTPGSFNAQGWLNWFELFPRQQLSLNASMQVPFRDWQSVGNASAEFILGQATASSRVWDVTDPLNPQEMKGTLTGTSFHFTNDCSRLREYIAFEDRGALAPTNIGKLQNQNLHAASVADLIIIVPPAFISAAQRLVQFHQQHDGLRSLIVNTEQVYNEFAGGRPDPTAIRDFVKMYHDKYRNDPANRLRYLLLFGDASYDYKDRLLNNTNLVPAFESAVSLDILSTYTSDDYFGFLDDNEDIGSIGVVNNLDIGIGRVPAKNPEEAKNFVDKVLSYFSNAAYGPWRNNLLFIADDEDQNLHLQDAELITSNVSSKAPVFDRQKIYLDAYRQESGAGGSSYPQVNDAINNQIYNGTLIWNFTGHGGPRRLADETILDQDLINAWANPTKLPLFLTATCDFAPYDNPTINSIGENILLRSKTGGIALMTTTRIVFSFSNRIMNNNYLQFALQPDANGKYRSLGDAVREAKNYTYQTSSDIINNRKFTLLGDPALTLAFPQLKLRATAINGVPVAQADTLRATDKVIIEGEVTDFSGNALTGFSGNVYPTVFDKPQNVHTLANDPTSIVTNFSVQSNVLFKGKASVQGGKFIFSFKVPRDINYQYGNGKLSLYAEDGTQDGNGFFSNFVVGGAGTNIDNDKDGPVIRSYLNDEKFVNGGLTNEQPVLLLKLTDSSGINTVGTGIGHDIVATLDNDTRRYFVLNDYYESERDSYQKGTVRFQLPALEPGIHTLKVKAWDVLNNSSEVLLDFTVAKDEELILTHVLNYPNPFTTHTQFWFEHNKPGQDLTVRLQIFTLTGRVIKVMQKTINTIGNRSSELEWDGRDEFGGKIGRGVYLYRLSITAPGKLKKEKIEKLVIF